MIEDWMRLPKMAEPTAWPRRQNPREPEGQKIWDRKDQEADQ